MGEGRGLDMKGHREGGESREKMGRHADRHIYKERESYDVVGCSCQKGTTDWVMEVRV